MKKIALPVLVLLLALGLGAVVWFVSRGSPGVAAPKDVAETASSTASKEVPKAELAPTPLETAGVAGATDARAGLVVEETGAEKFDISKAVWVAGVVRIPAGCVDEKVEVFALAAAADADALARYTDEGRRKDSAAGRNAAILARRAVAPDGSFRLPFPPGTTSGFVGLMGRYVYTPEARSVDLTVSSPTLALDPLCGARITGTIALPAESPVALAELDGLEVHLRNATDSFRGRPDPASAFRRRTFVSGGAFELRAVPVADACRLTTDPEKLAGAEMRVEDLAAGRDKPLSVALLRGAIVRGVVRGPQGEAQAGATVEAAKSGSWFGFDDRVVRSAKSGADGSFELLAVSPGKIVLKAKAEGFLEGEAAKVDLVDGATRAGVELALASGRPIAGTIEWAGGEPAAMVAIQAHFDMSQMAGMGAFNALKGATGSATSDEHGAFRILGMGEGPFTLEASAPERGAATGADAPAQPAQAEAGATTEDENDEPSPKSSTSKKFSWRARADGVKPGAVDVRLVLREPEGLAGRVVDDQGAPIATFRIEAKRSGQGMLGSLGQESRDESFDDAQGRFLVTGLFEGTWKVYAVAKGYGAADPVEVVVPRDKGAPEIAITLQRAASVAGIVKGPKGERVPGASVQPDNGEPRWKQAIDDRPAAPKTKSGEDGTFRIEGLRPGKVTLVADAKDRARSLGVAFDLAPGQVVEGAELVMRDGGTLTGEVFGAGGKPAAGMFVQASETKVFDQSMTFTDAKGAFRLEHLEPGTWQVVSMPAGPRGAGANDVSDSSGSEAPGAGGGSDAQEAMMSMVSKMKTAVVTIVDHEETHVVLGAPPKDPVAVHGKVTHAGEPWAGALVTFVAEGKDAMKGMKHTQVDKSGEYKVDLDAPGRYDVSVQRMTASMSQQSVVEFPCEIPEAKEYRLDLEMPTARISGRVTGPNGEPAANARVSLHPERAIEAATMWGGQYTESSTDADGRFDLQALRAGTYAIGVGGMSMGGLFGDDASFGREVRGGLKLSDGEWMRDVDFRLKKPGTIDVTVVDAAGAAVSEAAVFVRDAAGRLVDRFSMTASDANGRCHYAGLSPGLYTVSARKDLLVSLESARVRVDEGGKTQVQVALQPGTILLVTFVDSDQKPVQAAVDVQDDQGREVGAMISLADVMKLFGDGGFTGSERRVGPLPPGKYKIHARAADGREVNKLLTLTGQPERKVIVHFD